MAQTCIDYSMNSFKAKILVVKFTVNTSTMNISVVTHVSI